MRRSTTASAVPVPDSASFVPWRGILATYFNNGRHARGLAFLDLEELTSGLMEQGAGAMWALASEFEQQVVAGGHQRPTKPDGP